jgi:outer membrane immunogenic protein
MKKPGLMTLSLAALALGALLAPALAADLPVAAPYQPPPPRPIYNWTGCSVGVNIGGGWASKSFTDTVGTFGPIGANLGPHSPRGVVGGVQAGCDYRIGPVVLGVQGLYAQSGMKANNFQPNAVLVDNTFIQWVATATGRIGYTVTPTTLLYVKAGGAWMHDIFTIATFNGTVAGIGSRTPGGWTVGAGFEYVFFTSNWSVFLEYDYIDVGTQRVNFTNSGLIAPPLVAAAGTFPLDVRQKASLFLFGVNYRFNAGLGPVVARY